MTDFLLMAAACPEILTWPQAFQNVCYSTLGFIGVILFILVFLGG